MQEVYDFLKKSGVYYLGTVDGDKPRMRPFGTVDIFDGKLYIQTGKVKDVSKQMHANPKVEICAMTGGAWIRLEGEAVLDDRPEAQEHMLEAYPGLKGRYAVGDGNTEVWYIKNATATIYANNTEPKIIKF
ncbi:pyridoxamine 5'-phosphate oxidase [Oxobacter pfennigii]|uniref:Pyridoxamine 5'-phosphate oxidase n=1 Tax=Oxobacter pfennigii TaxID=36849 RepID=A0A0N8NTA2_9CLOT|nr:pyridoxamine 5'-phosphate oxidase family protein [Oxobacter pfennigii]KPU44264.1 pyridoxamine 5'-phosphate oxidase [Oxobacter pfennigii]